MYQTLYRPVQAILKPIHRRISLNRILLKGLGGGRPNRKGRALVSFITGYAAYLTEQHSKAIWDDANRLQLAIDDTLNGKYARHALHVWSVDLIRQLINAGFVVDAIYDRSGYLLEDVGQYDVIIDEWTNMERWGKQNPAAKKWYFAVAAHWLFWNRAEMERVNWLFQRRNVLVLPERQLAPHRGLEQADMISYVGNEFIHDTFGVFRPKLQKIQATSTLISRIRPKKDWASAKKRFIYFGSTGWVHRGLDLVIEAFLRLDYPLLICGGDDGFLQIYGEQIEESPNIEHVGFVIPDSTQFHQLMQASGSVVYASSAEGCSTSILQCMQFGLIPLVTLACGQDIHHLVPPIVGDDDEALITNMMTQCQAIAQSSDAECEALSSAIWEYALENHSHEAYSASLKTAMTTLL